MKRNKRFLTSTEVAKLFGIGPVAAWRMMRQGRVPCISVGRRLYADSSAIEMTIVAQTAERRRAHERGR